MKLHLQSFKQESTQMYVGALTIKQILGIAEVDVYRKDGDKEVGYQRAPEAPRAMKVAKYLKSDPKPLIPTSVLLSYRGKLVVDQDHSGWVTLEFPDTEKLWIIDGQHRLFGFRKAIEEFGIDRLKDYSIPVVIVENPSLADEATQFRVINETMKKVRTDLARHILAMRMVSEGSVGRQAVRDSGRLWEAVSIEICKAVNTESSSPWAGRIQLPNEKKASKHIIRELSFSTSLKPLLTDVIYRSHSATRLSKMLIHYWNAWESLVPDAFSAPDDHVLMKTAGVFSLHVLLIHVLEQLRIKNISDPTVDDFKNILCDLDDYVTAEYWNNTNSEGAAMAGSMKGFSLLADAMVEKLNEVQQAN